VLGRSYLRGDARLPWSASIERGEEHQRLHTHILVGLPRGVSRDRVVQCINECWDRSDWSLPRRDFQDAGDVRERFRYITKTGMDSLVLSGKR
jgi:hypothetical protein